MPSQVSLWLCATTTLPGPFGATGEALSALASEAPSTAEASAPEAPHSKGTVATGGGSASATRGADGLPPNTIPAGTDDERRRAPTPLVADTNSSTVSHV